ncbi:MAG: Gfo/Idh/MocA family oxidoreductase [Verrucomicrobia bacterium]|nr:Gfo/Idh/MocA family oxidoreductase [Verrucomicrobiota bacterium]
MKNVTSTSPLTRRQFGLSAAAWVGLAGALPGRARASSRLRRLRIACVGAAGKGWDDLRGVSGEGRFHDIVALCDIDHRDGGEQPPNLTAVQRARSLGIGAAARMFPKAKLYADYRRMFEREDFDAVTVSTPDHMHATVALTALAMGKHVFVQKPLTQTVHESRVLREVARAKGVVTHMGNQYHSSTGYRCAVQVIRSGVIGKVREAHSFLTTKPVWLPNIKALAVGEDPVPKDIHWNEWIGVGQPRSYKAHLYHNFNWRAWKEYGTGSLGDMGCHVMDVVVWALDLGAPTALRAEISGQDELVYPDASTVVYEFPTTPYTHEGFRYTWSDGVKKEQPIDQSKLPEGFKIPGGGSLFIGDQGILHASPGSPPRLYPQEKFHDYTVGPLKQMFADLAAEKLDHYLEWPNAILAGRPANSSFDVAGPLNETVMLGTIAQRVPGRRLVWDAAGLRFNDPAATALVRRQYRPGWEIDALRA